MNNLPDEKKLIEAVQNGDQKAYGILIRQNQKQLFRYIYGLLKSFDATEDIVQEAFVKGFENIKRFNTAYNFYPWISKIARNLAYNTINREEKKESLDQLSEIGYDPKETDLGPLEQLMSKEADKQFYKAVMGLPIKYRSVFILRHFEKMDYSEIASYLKIPPGTVDSRLYRARKILSEALKELL